MVNQAHAYEPRLFASDLVHRYRRDELYDVWLYLLTPWCEERQRFSLRHDRESIAEEKAGPACPACERLNCLAHMAARRARHNLTTTFPR